MRLTRRGFTTLLLAAAAAPELPARAAAAVKVPTRGFSLPDWLAATPRTPSPATLAALRAAGFETIRLPLDPALVTDSFVDSVRDVLGTVTDHGFNAILDLHPGPDFSPPLAETAWTLLAPMLAGTSPDSVYAELLNEPPLSPADWHPLRDRLAATIRAAAPHHTLIWGPARVQGFWELADTTPLADKNAIVAVHYYTPMGFTHQCENWDDTPLARIRNLPYPTTRQSPAVVALADTLSSPDRAFLDGEFDGPWTTAHIANDFAQAAAWARRHNAPMMLGEFGVLDFCVDPLSRGNWVRAVRAAAESNGLGWSYWEADQGFGFIPDRNSLENFDQSMLAALLA